MEASPHPLQQERLAELRSYGILDTEREKDFDDIVRIASAICGAPISVVNLIDAERQWFKAEVGLGVRETPLATSLCSHAILEDDYVEIPDTLSDVRMADNPLCIGDAGLRFYAGALLKSPKGLPLGTLCVLDYTPRELNPLQRDAIRLLARQVMAQMETRKALQAEKILRQEVDHRVKNSLQALSSFVNIQARYAGSEEVKTALSAVQNRIDAVSAVHDLLYRVDAGASIDAARYMDNLRDHFGKMAPANITVDVSADPAVISSRQAAALGTLINEFVSNSIKHGFPQGRTGEISITLKNTGASGIEVVCSDNGVGIPDDSGTPGLGLRIIEVVCAELGGEREVATSSAGTRIALRFKSALT